MRKYLIVKESHHLADDSKLLNDEKLIKTGVGTIKYDDRQLGRKKQKPKFKNNPQKVLMKKR